MPQSNPDRIAELLGYTARIGRDMPPAWDGARIAHMASGPGGEYFGKVLPGRGLYLAHDLKSLGITKPIPHVYERSLLSRTVEAWDRYGTLRGKVFCAERKAVRFIDALSILAGRMVPASAITSYDGIITARAGGKADDISISKASGIVTVANTWSTMAREGGFPAALTYTNIPGGAVHTRADAGAWSLGLTNPTSPDKKYLLTFGYTVGSTVNMMILADLLVAAGNILATSSSAQTVNSTALARYTNGKGVLMTFDITTALSATAHNMTVNSYTNQDGTATRSTGAQTGLSGGIVKRLVPVGLGPYMQLQSADYGVRSVEQYTNSAALAAGVFALNLYFPLSFVPGIASNVYVERDSTVQIDGLTELVQNGGGVLGCLVGYVFANTTAVAGLQAFMRTCAG